MGFEDRTCWLVRAGARARYATDFVDRRQVSMAWDWPDVGDLAVTEDADIFLTLEAAGYRKPADDVRDIRIFTTRMAIGDVVVVPDTAADDLLFGEVAGEYEHSPAAGDHEHARAMRWFGRLRVSEAPDLLVAHTTNARQVIRRLPEQLHWQWLAGEVDDFLGRDVTDVPRIRSTRAAAGTRSTSTRTRRPATPPKPQPVLVPDRLCPACGLLRNPSMFLDDDDYCRDCA